MQTNQHGLRFSLVFLFLVICLVVFAVKLVFIQVFGSSYLAAIAEQQHNHSIELEPIRGTIYDRNLRPLALNVPVYSLYANPRFMTAKNKAAAIANLSSLLKIDPTSLQEKLNKRKYFVWIKRKLPLEVVEKIKQQKISGLGFLNESKRYYPNKSLSAHVIGFAGIDNNGLEGMEMVYDKELKGVAGWARMIRDAKQRDLLIEKSYIAPQDGFHLVLTIDETIQYIAERSLEESYLKTNAIAATIIVMDVKTGEILAWANRPTYNLEDASNSSLESRTNRALSYVYEPGSVFKIVTAAAALEEKAFVETDKIFCENGAYRVANHILHDHQPHGTLTFRQVFEQSSNIGVTKIAQKLGPNIIYQYAKKFRFGQKTNIDMKGEVEGNLKHPSQWSKTSIGAIPIGHEVTVTPLQMLAAMSTVANKGAYMRPFVVKYMKDNQDEIVKSFSPQMVDQVITPETAKRLTEILVGAVENGTAQKAKIPGMRVAGKTGTAQKIVGGNYSHSQFYATFVGFAPVDNPRLAVIVILDDPHPNHFGGTVCAPVFKEVVENSLRYLETTEAVARFRLPQTDNLVKHPVQNIR